MKPFRSHAPCPINDLDHCICTCIKVPVSILVLVSSIVVLLCGWPRDRSRRRETITPG
ncbi:hypothetical protein BDV41DRAFT_516581 [Aspergillus transmontanensis]|uniref:Uncharacterized protein n=1 Tax=Aspergillus transmontanensis TaxID=1034304 RepID=A0A5N6WID8_9EURO|nr:hypothetical protein BDV41DRAFT_516581 [Aspergillus transmontanensis]